MGRVALRGIRAHLVRFILSVLAVALGVAFVAGTFSLRSMLSSTFSGIVSSSMTGDAYVRGSQVEADGDAFMVAGVTRNRIPAALTTQVEAVDGVRAAYPDLQGGIVLVGKDGTAVINAGAPSFGLALFPDDPTAHIVTGRAPVGKAEVALEETTLASSGLAIGDTTTVVVAGELRKVTVVGEVSGIGALAGATLTFFDVPTATAAFSPDGMVSTISVYAKDGVSEQQLTDRLVAALPSAATAATGDAMRDETQASIDKALGFVQTFLLVFALISLFVGGFIISNTFTMLVRQRMRELALLRAVGASPTQVFVSVLVQAAVVGLVGAAFGVAGGLGLVSAMRALFKTMGMDLSGRIPLDTQTVVVSLVIGVVVSVLAAALPARRAALTKPVEAMRDDVATTEHSLRLRAVIGAAITAVGAAFVVLSVTAPDGLTAVTDNRGGFLGAGAGAVVIGVLMLAPVIARWSLGVLAAPFVALARPMGRLARGNVTRNPRRTASTASALVIGMALVAAASVLASSTQASMRSIVDEQFTTDFLVTSATEQVPKDAIAAINALPGVSSTDALWIGSAKIAGPGGTPKSAPIAGVDPVGLERSMDLTPEEGSLDTLATGAVAVQRSAADSAGWKLGDVITFTAEDRSVSAPIGAIINTQAIGTPVIAPLSVFQGVVAPTQSFVDTLLVTAKDPAALEPLRADLTAAVKPFVILTVLDSDQFASSLAAQVKQILTILYALLGLSIVIAVLGIINTLALSVIERTREIGLLRAVGLGRMQLAGTVTIESIMTALFGTVLGLGVGTAIASAMPTVFADQGFTTLVIPWASLGWMLVLAAVVGVFAALWPAVRAARLKVLDAVSYE